MSKLDLQLERARQEKDDLAKELEKAENEADTKEIRRHILFLKSTSTKATSLIQGQGMSSGNTTTNSFGTSSNITKKNLATNTRNYSTQKNLDASFGSRFQKRPILKESYRKICFQRIRGCPNEIPKDLRNKVSKFIGNNAISSEQYLRNFNDMFIDYEVEHEDLVVNFFVHSLT